jgi:hypothetical protein
MSCKKRMDSLWTFEMMTLCLSHIENEKCGLKKYVLFISISKLCIYILEKYIGRHIENFPIYIFHI